jgi:hypothetical protein
MIELDEAAHHEQVRDVLDAVEGVEYAREVARRGEGGADAAADREAFGVLAEVVVAARAFRAVREPARSSGEMTLAQARGH